MDSAGALSSDARDRLERSLAAFERSTGHQIVVHVTPSLEGLPIEDYSMEVAEAWKVGHKGLDNGVIVTVAPAERKVRIEVGYGLEGVIPDAVAARIVREAMLPAFRGGDLDAGVLAGVALIQAAARGEVVEVPRSRSDSRRRGSPIPTILLWLLVLAVFGFRGLFFLPFLGGGFGMGRGRGGFGGGGFGGGGGGFGGGGASGSW